MRWEPSEQPCAPKQPRVASIRPPMLLKRLSLHLTATSPHVLVERFERPAFRMACPRSAVTLDGVHVPMEWVSLFMDCLGERFKASLSSLSTVNIRRFGRSVADPYCSPI